MIDKVARVFNLGRGDKIVNETDEAIEATIAGFGEVMIPVGHEITLQRKGIQIPGNWKVNIRLLDGRVTLALYEKLETVEAPLV